MIADILIGVLYLLLAKFSSDLTRYQRNDLCNIFNLITKKLKQNDNSRARNENTNLILNLPASGADIGTMYLSGNQSI